MTHTLYNGKLIDESKALISIHDKGYYYDFAVYDSLKIVQGKPFFLNFHVDRLLESARLINLRHQFTKEQIIEWTQKLIAENKITDALIRTVLIGDPDQNQKAQIYIFKVTGLTYYQHEFYSKGVKVITFRGERLIPQAKVKNLFIGFYALREAEKQNAIDALLIDHDGNIREGTRSNFFAINHNTLISPPTKKILAGITRKIILEIAKNDFTYKEEDIPLDKIKDYDELMITSTSKNIMPIKQIDSIKLTDKFPKTRQLQKLFKVYYHKTILKQ